jgi:hypothetical protein
MESIDKDDKGIDVDTSLLDASSIGDQHWTDEQSKEQQAFVQGTLEENLRSKYSVIDRSVYDVALKVQPLNYRLEHAYFIPIITRETCRRDPKLKALYEDLDKASPTNGDDIRSQILALVERSGTTRHTITIVADVSVECQERFVITDKATGTIVAGQDQEHVVVHLVRFEMLVTKLRTFGKWIISDWDDMLDGNVWHLNKPNPESHEDDDHDEANSTKKDGESPSQ